MVAIWPGHEQETIEIGPLPSGLPVCAFKQFGGGYCGSAEEVAYTENFTLAGGTPGHTDTTHPFYTLHADFRDTWQQGALTKLEQDCIRDSDCQGGGDVPDNDYVDGLP